MNQLIEEAVYRMKLLNLHPDLVAAFAERNMLMLSEETVQRPLSPTELEKVREWEKETGGVIYHIIRNTFSYGICYSYLYVSKYTEEWEMARTSLMSNYPFVYVENYTTPEYSEYGQIHIHILSANGLVLRIGGDYQWH